MTSRFDELHLQSGRKIGDIMQKVYKITAYRGYYSLEMNEVTHLWSVFFYPDDEPNEVIRVATDLNTARDAKNAQIFHNVDRLKAIVLAKNGSGSSLI